ncbi:MAG: GAF domain-containing protein [Deltaproteobacteria bacterium]|nr:GAF domain-containing protein [Deltaproteobacteria bacterium]
MYSTELVDINMDFQTRRQRLRRRLLRVIIPIGAVFLIVASITTITMVIYNNNRRDALALSEELLEALNQRIHSEVKAYLLPASNLVRIGAEASREQIYEIWSSSRTPLGLQVIKTYPQLASFFAADPQGNFVMHKQNPDGTIDTKVIERESSNVKVTWIRRDAEGQVVNTEISGDDSYDPRARPWYRGAVQTRNLYWTDIYIFFTDKKPGLTVSYPLFTQDDQLLAVLGIDIHLEKISEFLANLKIGKNGRAMIIDGHGRLVAFPQVERTFKRSGDSLETVMLNELDDLVLTRAFNRFKIDGHGLRVLVVADRRYLNTVTSLRSAVGRDWSVMIVVPEEDFLGFLSDDLRKVYLMTGIIVIITGSLAALMVYQGLRADRNALLVLERKGEIEAQSRAFSELASKTALWDPDDIKSLEELTEIVSAAMAVRRASVWGYYGDERILKCEDSFDRGANGHTRGTVLKVDDYSQLLQDLIKGDDIIIADTADDLRTSELHRVYLGPLGCTSLLAIPVMSGGKLAGAIWFEHEETIRRWNAETISFARAIAGMLALRLAATGMQDEAAEQNESGDMSADLNDRKSATKSTSTPSTLDTTGSGDSVMLKPTGELEKGNGQKISFSERLLKRGLTQNSIKADVYDNVTVLVQRFTDPFALAEYFGGDKPTAAVDHLICYFEDLVDARRIDYWKIISDQIVCATGMADNSNRHVRAIADLALSFQDKCSHLFADLDKPMEFKMGIDTGGIIGSPVGRRQKSYNIWGEAVSTASVMADSGVIGGIQVSETAYRRLQQNYLFKVRGRYYLQNIGEISTYLLTGGI